MKRFFYLTKLLWDNRKFSNDFLVFLILTALERQDIRFLMQLNDNAEHIETRFNGKKTTIIFERF